MTKVVSAKEVQDALTRAGATHAEVANQLGVNIAVVRGVLYGHLKGTRGDAHKVAVALGIKRGIIVDGANVLAAVRAAIAA